MTINKISLYPTYSAAHIHISPMTRLALFSIFLLGNVQR